MEYVGLVHPHSLSLNPRCKILLLFIKYFSAAALVRKMLCFVSRSNINFYSLTLLIVSPFFGVVIIFQILSIASVYVFSSWLEL